MADHPEETDAARLKRYRAMAAEARQFASRTEHSRAEEDQRLAQLWTELADELEDLIKAGRHETCRHET